MPQHINPDPNIDVNGQRLRWIQLEQRLKTIEHQLLGTPKFGAIAPGGQMITGQTLVGNNMVASTVVAQLGFAAGISGQNITSTSFVDISGSSFTFKVPDITGRRMMILYFFHATADMAAGAGGDLGHIIGNIIGFNTTAELKYGVGAPGLYPGTLWFFPQNGIAPGTYTAKMQGRTDNGTTDVLHVDQFFHQIWTMGSVS